jgi:hypothetical protein
MTLYTKGQTIKIGKQKLNVILNELRDSHSLLISFDDSFMKTLTLSENKSFKSLDHFFNFLTQNFPIKVDRIGKNIILYQLPIKQHKTIIHSIFGKVYDYANKQGLPNAEIIINNRRIYTSSNGLFSYITRSSNPKNISVKHIGYKNLDTICIADTFLYIPLKSKATLLNEITVKKRKINTYNTHIGKRAGVIKLNPVFIKKLPGYGETSIYSFLRLMPGVLATGENSNDISIRGSSEGQNTYLFDNYRIYNPWYKLNEIGTINPLLIKDIEIYKAGYDSSWGENIGGVVNISGTNTVPNKKTFSFFINNFIVNAHSEIPLSKKSSIIIAARKNIKNSLNQNGNTDEYILNENEGDIIDNYYIPNNPTYYLADLNFKFLHNFNNKSGFYISAFGSRDKISLNDQTESTEYTMRNKQDNSNHQYASSLKYYNNSNSGKRTEFAASFSKIYSSSNTKAKFDYYLDTGYDNSIRKEIKNSLEEYRVSYNQSNTILNGNSIDLGIGTTLSIVNSFNNNNDTIKIDTNTSHHLIYAYTNFNINISDKINLKIGSRINYSYEQKKLSFEPRISTDYYINNIWKLYASTGIYNQYTYKSYILDKLYNQDFKWINCNKDIPNIVSTNSCLGSRYTRNNTTISLEIFFKTVKNKINTIYSTEKYYNIKSRNIYYGTDLYYKYQSHNFTGWLSYTLSFLKEKNDNDYYNERYNITGFDNKHELKCAISYSLSPKLTISANYIYGSGFKFWHDYLGTENTSYNRFDIGAFYAFNINKVKMECGCSILNILDRKNYKLDEFTRFGIGDDIISYPVTGLRFTPTFFIKVSF